MVGLCFNLSISTFNVNGINTSIKDQGVSEWIKKM